MSIQKPDWDYISTQAVSEKPILSISHMNDKNTKLVFCVCVYYRYSLLSFQ
jgi:hypothetical protein